MPAPQGKDLVRASGTSQVGDMDPSHESALNFLVSCLRGKEHSQEGSGLQGNKLRILQLGKGVRDSGGESRGVALGKVMGPRRD